MNFNFSSGSSGNSGRNHKKNEEDSEEDYYKLLQVDRDASFEEIKKAYRRLSMIHHPDKNGNCEESTTKFKQLANAYETLSDQDKRMMYDMGIRNGNMGSMPFDMNINPFDIFNMIFGSQVGQQQQQQQQQQHHHFSNLHDFGTFIKFGNGMPMQMPMPMPMPMGMGVHIIHPEQMEHIDIPVFLQQLQQKQHQEQKQYQQYQQYQQQQQQQQHSCEKNDIHITLEDAYNGIEKYIVKVGGQELCVCIPPGINDKEIIISTTSNGRMVHIIVNVKPHELFQRNGLDLILEKEISFKESLCGLEFSIKHVNGKTFHLQHKDGTIIKDGVSKTIQRLGMKDVNGGTGALTIIFKVVYPGKLTKDQIEKLSEIL
jgi:DnaJ family protein A protein 2